MTKLKSSKLKSSILKSSILLLATLFWSCQSTAPIPTGIQEKYRGVNPAIIIAVPPFIVPDPATPDAAIDHSLLYSEKIIDKVETKIIDSFQGQPNINGYPFSAVEQAIGKKHPTVLDGLNQSLKTVVSRFSSRDIKTRVLITPKCLARKSFLDFYSYCLSQDPLWVNNLNALSSKVLNADTALLVFIANLKTKQSDDIYQIEMNVATLLVDTNNAKLIWGNETNATLTNPEGNTTFPKWDQLIDTSFPKSFWQDFPGRIIEKKQKKENEDKDKD